VKKQLLVICMLLGAAAFFLMAPAHGTEIKLRAGGSEPEAQDPTAYQLDNGTVLEISGEPLDLQLLITRPGIKPVSIALPESILEVSSIDRVVGRQVAVIGDAGGGLYDVVLVDMTQYRIADYFMGYSPTISPDGRFIAFVKFYPTHPGPVKVSDFVLLYDVAHGAVNNRPAGISIYDRESVGTAVYPPGIKTQDPDSGLPDTAISYKIMDDDFFWSPDSSMFVFSAEHKVKSDLKDGAALIKTQLDLVLVDLAMPNAPKTSVFTVAACVGASCMEYLKSIEFGADSLNAHFGGGRITEKQRKLRVRYDQFRQ
jgi:hypothetical protein